MPTGEEQISSDECYRCGYDLRGIANEQACPECGLLAERSRRVSDELHDTRPRWLRKLSLGVWLIVLALVLLPILSVVMDVASDWAYSSNRAVGMFGFWDFFVEVSPLIGPAVSAGVFLLGVLALTAREQYGPADRADRRRRVWLRILALVPLIGVIGKAGLAHLEQTRYSPDDLIMEWLSFGVSVAVLVAAVPLPALVFYQLRSLARRAHSAHLAEHCAIVGIGMSLAVLYGAAVMIMFQCKEQLGSDPEWGSRSTVSLILILVCTTASSLFALWVLYLLIRFAIAFRSAANQLRRKWKMDDRAGVEPAH